MNDVTQTQLAVIGAGPGGYTAAFLAADQGLKVTLIDRNAFLGGTCLHEGCIPSKALLSVAKTIDHARKAKDYGIYFEEPKINIEELAAFKQNIISKISAGLAFLCKQKKVQFIQGDARFANARSLIVKKLDGSTETIDFENCIIATGSKPVRPSMVPEGLLNVILSSEALLLKDIPETLLVIGGGYIGLEMASVYAGLGSKVTICEMLPHLLNGTDPDLVSVLMKNMKKKVNAIKLATSTKKISSSNKGVKVTFEQKEGETEETFSKVLVATGRKPNVEGLDLSVANVQQEKNGLIKIDADHRTDNEHIYAVGDIVPGPMLAHKASHEAVLAVQAILKKKEVSTANIIPAVIFTDPEIAYCGLTEQQAKEQKIDVRVVKYPWMANGRAVSLDRTDGFTKLIFDAKSQKLLGAGIVGVEAGELIAQALLSLGTGADTKTLAATVYPHPTLSETFKECLELSLKENVSASRRSSAEG